MLNPNPAWFAARWKHETHFAIQFVTSKQDLKKRIWLSHEPICHMSLSLNLAVTWIWLWSWNNCCHQPCCMRIFFLVCNFQNLAHKTITKCSHARILDQADILSYQEHQATASHWLGIIWLDNSSSKTVSNSWVACTSWFALAKRASSLIWAIIVSPLRTTVKGPPGGSPASSADLFKGFKVPLILTSRPGPWMDIVYVQAIGWCAWWPAATFWHSPVDRNLQIMPQSKYDRQFSLNLFPAPNLLLSHRSAIFRNDQSVRPRCPLNTSKDVLGLKLLPLRTLIWLRGQRAGRIWSAIIVSTGHLAVDTLMSEKWRLKAACNKTIVIKNFWLVGSASIVFDFAGSAWLMFVMCSLALCRLWAGSDFALNYWAESECSIKMLLPKFAKSTAALVCQLRLVQSMQEPPAQPLSACARQPFDLPTSTICWLNAMPKEMDTLSLDICALFQISNPVGHVYHLSNSVFKFLKNLFLTLVCPAFCLQLHLSRLQSMADDKHGGWKLWVRHWVWVLKTFLWNWLEFHWIWLGKWLSDTFFAQ